MAKDLDIKLSKQDKEHAKLHEAYAKNITLVTKWVIGILLAAVILSGGAWSLAHG
jgi:hypothetical protein